MTEGEVASRRASRVPKSVSGRYEHAGFACGTLEDGFVGGSMHSVVDNVDRVVPGGPKSDGHPG